MQDVVTLDCVLERRNILTKKASKEAVGLVHENKRPTDLIKLVIGLIAFAAMIIEPMKTISCYKRQKTNNNNNNNNSKRVCTL